jgi:hypothetical protein
VGSVSVLEQLTQEDTMAGTPKLRVEISGLCFVLFSKAGQGHEGLHALMVRNNMGKYGPHEPRLLVDPRYTADKAPLTSDGYYSYPIGGDIVWPGEVSQTIATTFPSGLLDVTKEANKKFNRALFQPPEFFGCTFPLNFKQVDPPPSMIDDFDLMTDPPSTCKPKSMPLFLKLAFETTLTGPTFSLKIPNDWTGQSRIITFTAVADWIELRFKNDPHDLVHGRDPVPGDLEGESDHFRMLYALLEAGQSQCEYIPKPPSTKGMRTRSSLFTCMPGGGH